MILTVIAVTRLHGSKQEKQELNKILKVYSAHLTVKFGRRNYERNKIMMDLLPYYKQALNSCKDTHICEKSKFIKPSE
jgi:hypothetical protein